MLASKAYPNHNHIFSWSWGARCFYFEALPQLHYMEQMLTQAGSQWLTAVTSSPITGHVSEVELQNENQRAQYKQEKMWLWFYILLMATWFVMTTVPFPGDTPLQYNGNLQACGGASKSSLIGKIFYMFIYCAYSNTSSTQVNWYKKKLSFDAP